MDTATAIATLKARLGDQICIAGHHYQHESVVQHCDIVGDSLELARKVAAVTAPHIILCGVFFMAESAALLARPGQKVYLPDHAADCVMARMTPAALLEEVLQRCNSTGGRVVPLAYVNTSLAVKSVVGRFGGAVCTSANAAAMLRWALDRGERVLFLPDANLGRNMARQVGLSETEQYILNIRRKGREQMTFPPEARLLLWPGCCAVHAKLRPEHVAAARAAFPGCVVAVHPECTPETVLAADGAGSTSYLIRYVTEAPAGSTVVIGTEENLVERLRVRYAQHCTVRPLRDIFCSNMAKISAEKLLATLQDIAAGRAEAISIKEDKAPARAALERMLETCRAAGV